MHSFVKARYPKKSPALLRLCAAFTMMAMMAAHAESVSFSGKVVDETGAAIPWALIKVDGSELIGQSGADGSFSLSGNMATVFFYPDPKPNAFRAAPESKSVPARYLVTGRAAWDRPVAATLLLALPDGDAAAGKTFPLASAPRVRNPAPSDRPPAPPVLAKASALSSLYGLTVSSAHCQANDYPLTSGTAKSLVIALAESASDTAVYAAEKKLCLDTINAYRAQVGLAAVAWSKSLEAFADQGARYDAERNVAHGHFSAFSKNAVPSDAENAIPGWPIKSYKTVSAVVAEGAKMMWAEGPGGGHYENIKGNHTQVGCGIYVTPAGAVWVIHDFK